ncbi:MAG: TIGR02678 family protein, partial [Streptomyces sp.]|nr:TIGR02678 family protein [Streptomyces sp.]
EEGPARLADDAVRILLDVGLAGRARDRVVARPAAYRYRLTETTGPAPKNDPLAVTTAGSAGEGDKQ